MSQQALDRIVAALSDIELIDPHSHINPHDPASHNLADILGYHYYTELAHSAGLPADRIEESDISPKELVSRLVPKLDSLDNTIQLSWLVEIARELLDVDIDRVTSDNWEQLYDAAEQKMSAPDWESEVLKRSKLKQVFLTNDFDDPLEGFDTDRYIPCLRTDDLVFHLHQPSVRERVANATGVEVTDAKSVWEALGKLFSHFKSKNAKACAISLPPDFVPTHVTDEDAEEAFMRLTDGRPSIEDRQVVSRFVFWSLAEMCAEHRLPFDLMIGVNRSVYPAGVHQGRDLYDSRCSLSQYAELFNFFPQVTFPVSVLAPTMNQELVSYAWIFPNVVTSGHWWYSNIPAHIEPDCRARLQAVPRTKQIGYYSDMYKLEFGLPKFAMYRRVLAKVLLEDFVIGHGWSEERAVDLGQTVLRSNVESIFFAD
ncbi:glucuronate isomerase [Stratiformator vulcanicus]|uniref:Glucuronate isomerase n=1 Tax=Stratiformator vulcanicus TaxID=2527980 RepID=A0A517R392_9PLAN|nr:glucuronate isomerase [Stratiformator vulcanicus]QDT38331.1 glucuronate isomerase [Stratiformator vulcanicus]